MTGRVARRRSRFLTVALVLAAVATLVGGTGAQGQEEAVLGTADDFAVLAASTVTNVGTTVIRGGDVGVSPGSAITGFPPGVVVDGVIRRGDAVAAQAQNDARTAYNNLAGRSSECTDLTGQDLGDVSSEADPLEAGVYCFTSSAFLTGTLYLEAGKEYVFLVGSTLITMPNSSVVIVGGAQDGCNIYWVVGTSATLGTDTEFLGTIIADASITLNDRAEVNGRLIALTGAVTLIDNDITVPTCPGPTTTTLPDGTTTTLPDGTTTTLPDGTTTTLPDGTTTTLPDGTTTTLPNGTTTTLPDGTTTTLPNGTTTTLPNGTTTTLPDGTTTTLPDGTTTTLPNGTTTTLPNGTTTTLLPGGGGQGPTTTAPQATTTTRPQATTTTGLAATTTITAAPATTTTARAATTTTVRPGTTGTTVPGGGTGLGAGGTDSLRVAGSRDALALTGPAPLQPMVVAALLALLLGAMMLMSSGPGVSGLLVAAGPQHGGRRGDEDQVRGRDLQSDAGTSQRVTPVDPSRAQGQVLGESDSRRPDISPADATRSALRSAESISWTLRLPEA